MLFPDDAGARKVHGRVEDVHVPAAATAQSRRLAENLGRHLVEVDAFGDRDMMRPVGRGDDVGRRQMRADADGARLLAFREMHLAGYGTRAHVEGWRLAFHVDLLIDSSRYRLTSICSYIQIFCSRVGVMKRHSRCYRLRPPDVARTARARLRSYCRRGCA